LLTGSEVVGLLNASDPVEGKLRGCAGVIAKDKETGETHEIMARVVLVGDGQNSRIGRELGVSRRKDWPMGLAIRGYYRSDRHDEPWIESHLDIRSPEGDVVPGYGWIFPLGDGRVNVGVGLLSTDRAWKGVNTTKLQEYFVAQTAEAWGLNEATSCGPATGGRLPMGLALGPRIGPNTLTIGDAMGSVNPFNGEGISYGYETGRLAAGVVGEALLANDLTRLAEYETRIDAAYGDYYKVARMFVKIISEPQILAVCVKLGLRIEPLMKELLAIMANLMSNGTRGPAELGFNAMSKLVEVIPEGAIDKLLDVVGGEA
jgi:flavin-dependent dehydrogenase